MDEADIARLLPARFVQTSSEPVRAPTYRTTLVSPNAICVWRRTFSSPSYFGSAEYGEVFFDASNMLAGIRYSASGGPWSPRWGVVSDGRPVGLSALEVAKASVESECFGQILDYGTMRAVTPETVEESPETPSGFTRRATALITKTTDMVPAKLGQRFGILYVVECPSGPEPIQFTKTVAHPPITRPDGTVSESFRFTELHRAINGVVSNFTGYAFDHSYELVPGSWRIGMEYNGRLLFEKAFTVYVPTQDQ